MGGDLGGDGKWVDASRRNWKAPDNKLLEILFMFTGNCFTGNFVHVYWKFCSCSLEKKMFCAIDESLQKPVDPLKLASSKVHPDTMPLVA